MDYIVIKFPNDHRTINFDKVFVQKYPLSIISAHFEVFPELSELSLDIAYDEFEIIYDVILEKIKQWEMPENILHKASRFGLVNDELYGVKKMLDDKNNDTFSKVTDFLNTFDSLFVPDSILEYFKYKKIFIAKKNIIPFQVVIYGDIVCCINIYDGLPIYIYHISKYISTLVENKIELDKHIDINNVRRIMLFTGYDKDFYGIDSECVDRVSSCDKIYNSNELVYLQELVDIFIKLAPGEFDLQEIINFAKIEPPNHTFSNIINNDICEKICVVIQNNNFFKVYRENILNHKYLSKHISISDSSYHCTYDYYYYAYCGFINIDL